MYKLRLQDVYLGENDGKKEAVYRSDFERYFVDIDDNYEKLKQDKYFLVLGRKGSGKTYLGQYVKRMSSKDPLHFCEISSYKDFKFQELIQLKSGDITPNEYYEIWRWLLLLDIGKHCLADNGIEDCDDKSKLHAFPEANYKSIEIDAKKIVEVTQKQQVRGGFLKSFVDISDGEKLEEGTYLDYIDDLEKVVFSLLSLSESSYTSIYDELDDRFRNDDYYRNSIISLIKAADYINLKAIEVNSKAKVVILLRSDIFSIFNDPDLNKIKRVNTLKIDWGTRVSVDTPLIKMVIYKAKQSSSLMSVLSNEQIFRHLFPQDINYINPERYILERSFFRPRDVITILNLIIEKYPNSEYFGWKSFRVVKQDYSEYLLDEVRNEMFGHYLDEEIDNALKLLKNYNKHFIEYDELKKYMTINSYHYPGLDLEKMLIGLFKFNAIGNKWFNEYKKKQYYTWAHRDEKADLDLNKTIVIHLGLREALSM
ncbi:P-loop ATPase, Sll1717 family [Desulfotalea psychrophila]|uniref:FunZ protein n=1 Tax=Desulfotalea psychrophila (strain LSv54 / DSM 12343) TaxID=177439 RepID=Q6ALN3_DESPS|nr:hypothetical protein [Desulfotalea psychrophila]CAG36742.1 hypothetical protein DP2013 [Desulfotalea psychrophila LSv54]